MATRAGPLLFLKFGGSLLTDKTRPETLRTEDLERITRDVQEAVAAWDGTGVQLVIGHGSGSFGHVAAAKHDTINGVSGSVQWKGFCEVSDAASRLNRLVMVALLRAGVPAISLQPAASAMCRGGSLLSFATEPIKAALRSGLVPVIHGDVAFDEDLGGTIASTEELFRFLAVEMNPTWILLAGETEGVMDVHGKVIREITPASRTSVDEALGNSRGTDVTGGMASKVRGMLSLVEGLPGTRIRIFNGLEPGVLKQALFISKGDAVDNSELGTIISALNTPRRGRNPL